MNEIYDNGLFGGLPNPDHDGVRDKNWTPYGNRPLPIARLHPYSILNEALFAGLNPDPLVQDLFTDYALSVKFSRPYGSDLKKVDGSDYVQDAFGGFGPDSPEYDCNRRLQILVPDPEAAVSWFEDTVIDPKCPYAIKSFANNIPKQCHPGVKQLEVIFTKSPETSLVSARIDPHLNGLKVDNVPLRNGDGLEIDTFNPAKQMLAVHMEDRLKALFPDKVQVNKNHNNFIVALGDGVDLDIDGNKLPYLTVTVNGNCDVFKLTRYGNTESTPRQLKKELLALQDHFPGIAEVYADFFRQQLPKTQIVVD